jgi:uracil-DNA glycosylase
MNTKRAVSQLLKHLASIGVTHLPKVTLQKTTLGGSRRSGSPRTQPQETQGTTAVSGGRGNSSQTRISRPGSPAGSDNPPQSAANPRVLSETTRTSGRFLSSAELQSESAVRPSPHQDVLTLMKQKPQTSAQKADALCLLAGIVSKCTRCTELATTRTQTVFGVGRPDARIMFIGEAPGADEDACGEPFVGRAGQLMNKIIVASQLKREDLYICNILRCRPPGNRNPLPQEAANCREYLDAQIAIVRPEYIICWGTVAAQNLLGEKRPIGKLRGQFLEYQGIRVLCTYHPSYLLRYPSAKTQVWDDMKFFMKELGVDLNQGTPPK